MMNKNVNSHRLPKTAIPIIRLLVLMSLVCLCSADEFELKTGELPPLTKGAWTVVVIPDTQGYTSLRRGREENVKVLDQMFAWMAENKESRNLQVALHVGDMTAKNQPEEWVKIRGSYRQLDGVLPYVVCVGNHDERPTNRKALINEHFKISQNPLNQGFFVASYEEGKLENACYEQENNGQKFLFLALEFAPRDAVLEWANDIIKERPDHRVFITVHEYISEKSRLIRKDGRPAPEVSDKEQYLRRFGRALKINFGVDLKRKLIDPNPNVEFLTCGHYGCQKFDDEGKLIYDRQELATAHRSDPRETGAAFHAMLFNAQWIRSGGDGWMLLLEFQPDNKTVQVRTYSPHLKAYRVGPEYHYVLHRKE